MKLNKKLYQRKHYCIEVLCLILFASWFNFKLVFIYDVEFHVCSDWFSEPEIVAQKLDPLKFFKWCFSSIHFTLLKDVLKWFLLMWRFQYLWHCCMRKLAKFNCFLNLFYPKKQETAVLQISYRRNLGYSLEKKWQQKSLARLWKCWWQI